MFIEGVARDVLLGERARALHHRIGKHAEAINKHGYGELFGAIQNAAVGEVTLSIAKIYERPGARYKIRSIPEALKLLKEHAAEFEIRQLGLAGPVLQRLEIKTESLEGLNGAPYTIELVRLVEIACPDPAKAANCALSRSLDALRMRRDKLVAHNEVVLSGGTSPVTWKEVERLLGFARHTLGALALTYFDSVFHDDSGIYLPSGEAEVAGSLLRRLLYEAGVE